MARGAHDTASKVLQHVSGVFEWAQVKYGREGNVGARPLQVRALLTDCACLSATAEAAKLPSGSRTHLVLTYDSAADPGSGAQTHHLALLANDPQTPRQDVTIRVTRP